MMDLFAILVLPVILGVFVSLFIYTISKHHKSKVFTIYAVFSGFMVFRCILCLGLIVSDNVSMQLSTSGADIVIFYDACTRQMVTSFNLFALVSFILLIVEIALPIIREFRGSEEPNKEAKD